MTQQNDSRTDGGDKRDTFEAGKVHLDLVLGLNGEPGKLYQHKELLIWMKWKWTVLSLELKGWVNVWYIVISHANNSICL